MGWNNCDLSRPDELGAEIVYDSEATHNTVRIVHDLLVELLSCSENIPIVDTELSHYKIRHLMTLWYVTCTSSHDHNLTKFT